MDFPGFQLEVGGLFWVFWGSGSKHSSSGESIWHFCEVARGSETNVSAHVFSSGRWIGEFREVAREGG